MRVLVLTNMYPPHHLGGYELTCRDTVQRWRTRGHDVEVLTTTMRLPERSEDAVEERSIGRRLEFYWREHEILNPPFREKLAIERGNQSVLGETLDRFRPDIVSAWHMGGMSLGLLTSIARRRLPIVYVVLDNWPVYAPLIDGWMRTFRRLGPVAGIFERLFGVPTRLDIAQTESAFCFISEFIRQQTRRVARAWPNSRSTVVYAGIDGRLFSRARNPDEPWRWRLISVGRVEERKGVHVAVQALAQLPREATLEIDGPVIESYKQRVEESIASLGLSDRVRFSLSSRETLADRYSGADAFVFPVIWDEPFGLTPVEAMSCGTPVVGSATGGSREYLIDEVNYLDSPRGDASSLARAVRRLADDGELRRRLVAAGRKTAAYLDIQRMSDALEDWHLAATRHFRDGVPPSRPEIRSVLGSLVGGSDDAI